MAADPLATASVPLRELAPLLAAMRPALNVGVYVFVVLPPGSDVSALEPLASFRESEGVTVILAEPHARAAGLKILFRASWITLSVHSDLHAVGLTAAVANALTRANISCNVVAAAYHDHLFVPVESAHVALEALLALQRESAAVLELAGAPVRR